MQVFKIVFTIMVVNIMLVSAWMIIDEITHFKNWVDLAIALLWFIVGALDIYILWFA